MMAAIKNDGLYPMQAMSLKELLNDFAQVDCVPEINVTGLSMDSRTIQSGDVFVALSGQTEHGLAFVEMAIKKGAVAILCDREFDQQCQKIMTGLATRVLCIPVDQLSKRLGELATHFYHHASEKMFTVGVTGTDGKTSVSHFIAQAFDCLAMPSAVIGTIGNGFINQLETATHTTPDVIQVHKYMADMQVRGAETVSMEVSSHGLDQGRIAGLNIDVAVLTNLARDHLDYHGDIESYAAAKKKLFLQKNLKCAVINMDDEFGVQLAKQLDGDVDVCGYSLHAEKDFSVKNMVSASNITYHAHGLSLHVKTQQGEANVSLALMGRFNVSNALAALSVLLLKGVEFASAIKCIEQLKTVAGRMQSFSAQNKARVIVDYAHTPQAMESVLIALKQHSKNLICVFGCGGDRDRGKRPLMAKIAQRHADVIFVTDDNPRHENAEKITDEIFQGFSDATSVQLIHDRKQAIHQAIAQASEQDVILIAGKGHEDYQIVGSEKHYFSDAQVVKQCLEGSA